MKLAIVRDMLGIGGVILVLAGLSWIYAPLGPIGAGLLMVAIACMLARRG